MPSIDSVIYQYRGKTYRNCFIAQPLITTHEVLRVSDGDQHPIFHVSQLAWQDEAPDGQAGVQPAVPAGAEEAPEGVPPLHAGLQGAADQEAPGVCSGVQRAVRLAESQSR